MKFPTTSPYGYQILERSRRTVTKYLSDEKTHVAIVNDFFRRLNHLKNALNEVELAKEQVYYKNPIIVELFILHYAKIQKLELVGNFSVRFLMQNIFPKVEMETDFLCLADADKNLKFLCDLK